MATTVEKDSAKEPSCWLKHASLFKVWLQPILGMADAVGMCERGVIEMGLIGKVFALGAAVLLPGGLVILCAVFFGRAFREAWLENAHKTLPVRVKATIRSLPYKRIWRETTRRR